MSVGRNQKTNFDFFRLDTGFFSNKKIKALRRQFGSVGVLTYLYILSYAYGNDGYYIRIDSVEDFAYDIAESIANSNLTQVASVATDCINYLASRGEINKHLLDKGVISGESIQRQYIEMCKAAKRKVEIKKEYLLVDTLEYPMEKIPISSEEKAISSEEIKNNSEEMQQIKGKETKYITHNSAGARESEFESKFNAFVDEFNILVDISDQRLIELDYDKLTEIYRKSGKMLSSAKYGKWLKTLSWIVRNYSKILNGNYKDEPTENQAERSGFDIWDVIHGEKIFNGKQSEKKAEKKDSAFDILEKMWHEAEG